jgi:hypothetical protein
LMVMLLSKSSGGNAWQRDALHSRSMPGTESEHQFGARNQSIG